MTAFLQCPVALEGQSEQSAAEGLRVTVAANPRPPKSARGATVRKYCVFTVKVPLESENEQTAAEGLRVTVAVSGLTAFLQCLSIPQSENEQTAAEGREVTVAVSGLTAFLQVFRASGRKVSKRLQRGVGHGSRGCDS